MTRIAVIALVTVFALSSAFPNQITNESRTNSDWMQLFDGETLEGWRLRGGNAIYEVRDKTIVGKSVPRTPNTFLCTESQFGDFELELQLKVDSSLNSGVQIRSHVRTDTRDGRVRGYQVEIDPSKRAWSGGIYEEAGRGWLFPLKDRPEAQKAFRLDDWNHYRVLCRGDSIRTWVNGVAATDFLDPLTLKGFIGLQVHGVGDRKDALTVSWRDIRLRDLGEHVWQSRLPDIAPADVADVWKLTSSDDSLSREISITDSLAVTWRALEGHLRCHWAGAQNITVDLSSEGIESMALGPDKALEFDKDAAKKAYKPSATNRLVVANKHDQLAIHLNGRRVVWLSEGAPSVIGTWTMTLDPSSTVAILGVDELTKNDSSGAP